MSRKENKAQNKVRMNISISREVYDWITKNRGNASRIAEQAYLALKRDMELAYGSDTLIIKLQNTGKNTEFYQNRENLTEKSWTRGKLNPRPLQCQCSDLPLIYLPLCTTTVVFILLGLHK